VSPESRRGRPCAARQIRMLAPSATIQAPSAWLAGYATAGLIDTFVIDVQDESLAPEIEDLELQVIVADTVMTNSQSRADLARTMLDAAAAARQ